MADNTYDSSVHGYFTSAAVQQSMNGYWHQQGNLAAGNVGERLQSDDQLQDQSLVADPVQILYSDPAYNDFYQGGQPKLSRPSHLVEINCEPAPEVSVLTHLKESTTHSHGVPVGKQWEDGLFQNVQLYKEKQPTISSHHPSTTAPPCCAHPLPSHSYQPILPLPSVTESQQTSDTQTVVSTQQSYWQQCSVASDQPRQTDNPDTHNNCKLNEGLSKSNGQELLPPLNSHQANTENQSHSLSDHKSDSYFVGSSNPNKLGSQHEQEFNCNSDGDLGLGELFHQSNTNLCVENQSKPPRIKQLDFPIEFWTKEMLFWYDKKERLSRNLHTRYKKKGYWSDKIHERKKEATRRFKELYRQCGEELRTRTDLDFEDLKRRKMETMRSQKKIKEALFPRPEAVPSTSEKTQPPSRRHWLKETNLTDRARQQAVARVMEKVFSNAEPFSRFQGLKNVVKKSTAGEEKQVEKRDKYSWEISCRNIDYSKPFSQNLNSKNGETASIYNNAMRSSSDELRDDSHHAQSPVALRGYPHYGPNLFPKSLASAPNVLSGRPKRPTCYPPNVLNCPQDWPDRPPIWRNRRPNVPLAPSNVFNSHSRVLGRGPDRRGRSPVPIQEKAFEKSRVVDVGLPCLYSMADRVEDNITVPVEKHLFSGCLTQPHNSKGGPFKRDSFIVPPQDNFLPLRDGPIVNRRDVSRCAPAAPSKLVAYKEGELGSEGIQDEFSGKFLKANYFRTPLYDPFTNSGLPEILEQPAECAVNSLQQTESDDMENDAKNISSSSSGKNQLGKRKHDLISADESSSMTQKRPSSAPDDPELLKLLRRVRSNLQNKKLDNHHQWNQNETSRAPQDRKNIDLSKRVDMFAEKKHAYGNDKNTDEIYRTHNKRCVEDLAKNVIKKLSERKHESSITKVDIARNSIPVNLIEHKYKGAVDQDTSIPHVEKGVERFSSLEIQSRDVMPYPENAYLKKLDKPKCFPEEPRTKEQIPVHPMRVHFEKTPALENRVILNKFVDCSEARLAKNIPSLFCGTEPVPLPDRRSRSKLKPAHNITDVSNCQGSNLSELLRRIEVNLDKKMSDNELKKDRDSILSGVRQSRRTAEVICFDGRQREGRSREDREMAGIPERLRGRLGGKVDPW